jgi:hypothetical protein
MGFQTIGGRGAERVVGVEDGDGEDDGPGPLAGFESPGVGELAAPALRGPSEVNEPDSTAVMAAAAAARATPTARPRLPPANRRRRGWR